MLQGGSRTESLQEEPVWPRGEFLGAGSSREPAVTFAALQPEQRLRGAVPAGRGRALGLPGVAEPVVSELCCSVWIAFQGKNVAQTPWNLPLQNIPNLPAAFHPLRGHAQVSVPTSLLPGKVMGSWSEEANGDIWAVPGLYHPKMQEVHQQVPLLRVL